MSAARPFPVPPVSKRRPGGRVIVCARSSTSNSRQRPAGSGWAGLRSGRMLERLAEGGAGHPGSGLAIAAGLDLPQQGGIDQAAAALRRPEPGLHRLPQEVGGGNGAARVRVQPAELAVLAEPRQRPVELAARTAAPPRPPPVAGASPSPGSPIRKRTCDPIASKTTSCSLMMHPWSPEPGPGPLRPCSSSPAPRSLRPWCRTAPGVGTTRVTILLLMTRLIRTGRG